MAWRAELLRRRWYCINGFDMISWHSKYLYDEWWNSLSQEQKERIEQRRKDKREREARECKELMCRLMSMTMMVSNMSVHANAKSREKYNGVYDEYGFPII